MDVVEEALHFETGDKAAWFLDNLKPLSPNVTLGGQEAFVACLADEESETRHWSLVVFSKGTKPTEAAAELKLKILWELPLDTGQGVVIRHDSTGWTLRRSDFCLPGVKWEAAVKKFQDLSLGGPEKGSVH